VSSNPVGCTSVLPAITLRFTLLSKNMADAIISQRTVAAQQCNSLYSHLLPKSGEKYDKLKKMRVGLRVLPQILNFVVVL
jgi:hypothetical protein